MNEDSSAREWRKSAVPAFVLLYEEDGIGVDPRGPQNKSRYHVRLFSVSFNRHIRIYLMYDQGIKTKIIAPHDFMITPSCKWSDQCLIIIDCFPCNPP